HTNIHTVLNTHPHTYTHTLCSTHTHTVLNTHTVSKHTHSLFLPLQISTVTWRGDTGRRCFMIQITSPTVSHSTHTLTIQHSTHTYHTALNTHLPYNTQNTLTTPHYCSFWHYPESLQLRSVR